ncbi:MAG: hypothetical protein Q7S50_02465 [bacterium]|nr:hypothetical protein [bacterium]
MSIKKPQDYEKWEFENVKMRKSLPEDVIPSEARSAEDEAFFGFLLTLAMIFNDFKGLILLNDTVQYAYKSEPPETNEHFGERAGIQVQLLKILYATVYEALVFIKDSKDIYDSNRVRQLLQRTSESTQLVWEMLNKIAHEESIDDERFNRFGELRDFLVKARNNVGFHYQTRKQLIAGYRTFFMTGISAVPEEARKWAYRSVKNNDFNSSRYYYADAALQGYYVNLFGDEKLAQQRTDETFRLVNLIVYAIHDLLTEYHASLPSR